MKGKIRINLLGTRLLLPVLLIQTIICQVFKAPLWVDLCTGPPIVAALLLSNWYEYRLVVTLIGDPGTQLYHVIKYLKRNGIAE